MFQSTNRVSVILSNTPFLNIESLRGSSMQLHIIKHWIVITKLFFHWARFILHWTPFILHRTSCILHWTIRIIYWTCRTFHWTPFILCCTFCIILCNATHHILNATHHLLYYTSSFIEHSVSSIVIPFILHWVLRILYRNISHHSLSTLPQVLNVFHPPFYTPHLPLKICHHLLLVLHPRLITFHLPLNALRKRKMPFRKAFTFPKGHLIYSTLVIRMFY